MKAFFSIPQLWWDIPQPPRSDEERFAAQGQISRLRKDEEPVALAGERPEFSYLLAGCPDKDLCRSGLPCLLHSAVMAPS
jgi:hypothetical protein